MGAASVVGVTIFGATMIILYLSSTLYHAFPHSKTKRVFRIFDHSAIFLLIAGTYTPFSLGVLPGVWGWTLFGIIWGLAIFGVVSKSVHNIGTGRLSIVLYLAMGWMGVLAVKPLMDNLPSNGFGMAVGGWEPCILLAFSSLPIDHRIRYSHFVWHLFVLAGTACHVVSILGYALVHH